MEDVRPLLTVRERQVVQLLSLGLSYAKIAVQMEVSHETVKMHLKNIYRKLEVQNKIEALQKVKLL
jgi:DNA-binding CsgD family transcriptional regulator